MAEPDCDSVVVEIVPGFPVVIPVRIERAGIVREVDCLLDTGASHLVIPPDLAAALGYDLSTAPVMAVDTAMGRTESRKILLDKVSIGCFTEKNVLASCLDMGEGRVVALLGLSLLSRFNVTIDNVGGFLILEARYRRG